MHETFVELSKYIQAQESIQNLSVVGKCRIWAREAIFFARKFREESGQDFIIQAREAEIEPFLFHTFLRIIIQGEDDAFLMDGCGTSKHSPFFGRENEAPHLLDCRVDPIQYYDLSDESED